VAKGSGHYQNVPGLVSEENEIWLDFTTDAEGNGSSTAVRDWLIRPGGASSVIIHDHGTDHMAGTAGPKLGCLDVDF
jgi:Cu-Zn family superoxide dismutase